MINTGKSYTGREKRQIFCEGIQSKQRMKKYAKDTSINNSNSPNKNKEICPSRLLYARTKLLAGLKT